jgi:DNA-binding Lrp family transcriptional regulator
MFGFEERKARKEMEMKMYLRQQKRNMEKIIKGLDKSREEIINRGKRAKEEGMIDQFKMCQSSLKFAVNQKLTAERMLLQLETAARNRDIGQMQKLFEGSMRVMNRDMTKTSKSMSFVKLQKEYNTALMQFEGDIMKIDMFLEGAEEDFESLTEGNSIVNDEEILKLFEEPDNKEIQNKLEKELSDLEKALDAE